MPVDSKTFDFRLVGYNPLGTRIGIIPDLGITISSNGGGPTLTAKVSTAIYGTLPTNLEVGVEWWNAKTNAWQEGRDSRFAITGFDADDRDLTGTVSLTGIGLAAFLLGGASLAGVTPYTATNVRSEAAASSSTVSVSGTTFTWASHVLANGDRVKVTSVGNAKGLTAGSIYYVRNAGASTFQLSATVAGAIKSCGTASNVSMSRVCTRIVFNSGSHSFLKSQAVQVTGGSSIGLNDTTTYYVVNPTAATIQIADKPGGIPIQLSTPNTAFTNIYRNLDGQRVFTNCTPGTVMTTAFLEARDGRGWGVGQDGVTKMLHGWTVGADSTGAAWTSLTNDPSTPGAGLSFQPGTPATQMLQALLDNQYAEWYTSNGRTIHLVNYGTGTDHTVATPPKRIGTTASAVKVETDLTELRNAVTVKGEGQVIATATSAAGPWGRLEVYETGSGITTTALAAKQAATDLADANAPQVAYTVTETAQEAAWVPLVDYSRGDWVAVQIATGWVKLRCVGWQFQKDANGVITVTTNLARVKKPLIAKIATKATKTTAGLSQTSTGQSVLESDNRKAAVPVGIVATTTGVFANDGSAAATISVSWLPVTADIDGGDLTIDDYEVWVRPEGAEFGQPVGQTHGLTLDLGPYPSNRVYGVSVRARSSTGAWGELSVEVEVTTAYPVTIPNPPTAPTVTGKLGTARVAWDGLLVDPTLGNVAPENGFAYVYAAYSTTSGGIYTPAGTNMGNAGYTPITGLTIGTTYWFALFARNTVGTVSQMSAPTSYTIVGVTGPDLVANSVTANAIAAGAITADKLDVGTVPQGDPVNRVPQPPFVTPYWGLVVAGTTPGFSFTQATSSATGLTLAAGGASGLRQSLTQLKVPAPDSRAISLNITLTSTASVTVFVRCWNSAGTDLGAVAVPAVGTYTLPATAQTYEVFVNNTNTGGVATTITKAQVFEVIGGAATGQAAQLSPSGLRLYDATGHLAIDLTTASQQFLNIYDNTGSDPTAVASVDNLGNATFAEVSGTGFDLSGQNFTNEASGTTLSQSAPNGSSFGDVPLLDRAGRGPIYDCTWDSMNTTVISTQYKRIAQDHFVLEDGRQYMVVVQDGGLQCANNTSGRNVYLELQFSTTPLTSVTSGDRWSRAVLYAASNGYYALPPFVFTARTGATASANDRILPAGVPIYWQINTNLSAAPTANYQLDEFGETRGLTVIDIGSSQLIRPNGGVLPNATDRSTTGGASGTTTGGTSGQTTTTTFTAAWSRTWNSSGSSIVSGSGTYTNGAAMYQGNGSSAMGSKFGFAALGLSTKTITSMSLYLYATYFAYSGKSALLGTHGDTAAPATYTGARANAWTAGFSGGQGKWVTVPSTLWAGFAAGTYRGFSLGVDGSDSNYAYFRGATQTNPPQLKVTYY